MVTIEDVAKAAGVSRQTVSRVINGSPNVRNNVRERIEAVVEELGYVPNLSARRMGGARSFLIIAINDRARTLENWKAGRGNDWVDQMLYGGMTECERQGYHFAFELIDTAAEAAARELAKIIGALRPDGVILTPPHSENPALVALLDKQGIPCARIGYHGDAAHIEVYMNESHAAWEVTNRLLDLGHKRLGFIAGSPTYGASVARIEGFRRAIAEAGLPEEAGFVRNGDFSFETAARVVADVFAEDPRPTAIIADNDEMAFAVLHVADRMKMRVPDKLSVVCFEDTPGVRFSVPPLSAIRQPTALLFEKACQRLIASAGGENAAGGFVLPFEFVERASTGPAQF